MACSCVFKVVIIFLAITFWVSNASQNLTNSTKGSLLRMVTYCTNPNDNPGLCMKLQNCPILYKQRNNTKAQKFLQESRCGPKNEEKTHPYVCCGNDSNYKKTRKHIFPENCGYENITMRSRILGGTTAALGQFPWLARLYHKHNETGRKEFGCTGFLITPRFVLTAAHCLQSENIKLLGPIFEVHLGEHNTRTTIDCNDKNTTCAPKVQKVEVSKNICHPKYKMSSRDHQNDIGLIYLIKDVQITTYVSTICISRKLPFKPFEYWLGGWGQTENDSLSHLKMCLSIPPFDMTECKKKYGKHYVKINETSQICAGGEKNKDSCVGDSGGPLMFADGKRWYAAGVVSLGLDCGKAGWPGVYTNVSTYSHWIAKTIIKYSVE